MPNDSTLLAPVSYTHLDVYKRQELDRESRYHVMRMMFGGQIDDFDFHYIGLTCEFMTYFFNLAGFSSARRVESFGIFNDTSDYRPYGLSLIHI